MDGTVIQYMLIAFVFMAYLILIFVIIGDLMRDHELSGWWKAVWIIALILIPWLTGLIYLIARGKGMAERSARGGCADPEGPGRLHQAGVRRIRPGGPDRAGQEAARRRRHLGRGVRAAQGEGPGLLTHHDGAPHIVWGALSCVRKPSAAIAPPTAHSTAAISRAVR